MKPQNEAKVVPVRLAEAIGRYGAPGHIRSDNGPEFIPYAIQGWLDEKQIEAIYIEPGSPSENGHIESFHDKFRDELLNREIFGSLWKQRLSSDSGARNITPSARTIRWEITGEEFAASTCALGRFRLGYALPTSPQGATTRTIKHAAELQF